MEAKNLCPHCSSGKTTKSGKYRRKRSRQIIQRYKCSNCNQTFSNQTLSKTYKQKRPDLNQKVLEGLSSGTGIRKMAMNLRTTKKTIQRKVKFLAVVCDVFHKRYMGKWDVKTSISI